MTLPASGTISFYQICDEFGLPHTSIFPTAFYGKGGAPTSGPLSFADFYGRSGLTFTPPPGSLYNKGGANSAGAQTVTASQAVTWTYTKSLNITTNTASGTTTTSITFSTTSANTSGTVSLTATVNGQSYLWDITLDGGNVAGGGGV
jgi:hypothetical protein